jgi:formylglycine-generating enzyme required for sulfatase activity
MRGRLLVAVLGVHVAGCHLIYPFGVTSDTPPGDLSQDDTGPVDLSPPDAGGVDTPAQDSGKPDLGKPDTAKPDGGPQPSSWVQVPPKGTKLPVTFQMGSSTTEPCRDPTNETQHAVTLKQAFSIMKSEVTQGQFQARMSHNPSLNQTCGPDCPVENVSWDAAAAYCNALSLLNGKTQCYLCSKTGTSYGCAERALYSGDKIYTCPGYRLPTDAEWELAYRAGATTAFHGGSNSPTLCSSCSIMSMEPNLHPYAWYCANSAGKITQVGLKQTNGWGLYDMAGNVWEWVHDEYQADLGSAAVTNPVGQPKASTDERVYRGGSFSTQPKSLRAATRYHVPKGSAANNRGFRCVLTL